ncbi:MAG TPA: DUF5017 domain-containing protein, partial [Flavobacteriaceae bacterium]|nr:DUF5017 domain-containing protein [Flavobacteriaceae bacterium]
GNFYKELFLQDDPVNPTKSLKIILNQSDTYNQFNQGREVYIYLTGLFIGEDNDSHEIITIGGEPSSFSTELQELSTNEISDHLFRSDVTETLIPVELNLSEVSESHIGIYVKLLDVQFSSSLEGEPFVDPYDDYDTQRTIESCSDSSTFILETSSFATFKNLPLPTERGTMSGIVNKMYSWPYELVFNLNTNEDIEMDDSRCDPVFEETFNSATDNTELNISGWTNYAEAGSELWTEQVYSGNGYAEFSAYGTGDSSNIGWLITSAIDLDAQEGELLSFETEHAYPDAGHDALEVLISTDWDGTEANITSATWTSLDFTSSLEADFDSWFTWTPSGDIDISSYTGTAYIAFKYTGSDTSNLNTTMHVENVTVFVP